MARRSSSSVIGPTRSWWPDIAAASAGYGGALAVEVGPHRQHHDRPAVGDRRRVEQVVEERPSRAVSSSQSVKTSSNWSTSTTSRRAGGARGGPGGWRGGASSRPSSEPAHQSLHGDGRGPGAVEPASATARLSIGSRPGLRITTGQSPLPSSAPCFRAATSPARASDDLPLPEAPTIARKRFSGRRTAGGKRVDQPLRQRLAAEEERRVLDVEDLQPAVGALPSKAAPPGPAPGSTPRMPQTSRRNASASSSDSRNSTQVVASRNVGSLPRSGRSTPGSSTGMTRNGPRSRRPDGRWPPASPRSARGRTRPGPMNTAQAAQSARARSMAGCQAWPGIEVPLVEPGLDPLAPQPDRQVLDGGLVGGVVREEDVVFEARHRHLVGLHQIVVMTAGGGRQADTTRPRYPSRLPLSGITTSE